MEIDSTVTAITRFMFHNKKLFAIEFITSFYMILTLLVLVKYMSLNLELYKAI